MVLLDKLKKDYERNQFRMNAREAFRMFDTDDSGTIESAELGLVFAKVMGVQPSDA